VVEIVSENPLRFRILSRDRDWVNIGGEKVNPGEVELQLLTCPGVHEARVHGRTNSVMGQILCAEVVAEPSFSEPAARAWLAERLPAAKIPRLIKIVPSLPRSRTGKLERPH
jgi:acyl-coenzyme A synthetase/AMP-(fatty) acid ligase